MTGDATRLSAAARLALACAAGCDDATVGAAADAIAHDDWPAAVALFEYHFIVPVVLARLRSARPDLPGPGLDALGRAVLGAGRRSLMLQATMRSLRNDHLEPLAIPFLVLKGLALGARYYGDPALRTTRDVDILVNWADLDRLLPSLVEAGYRPASRHALKGRKVGPAEQALAMAHLSNEVVLVSPQGIPVEVHHGLEITDRIFPNPVFFDRAEAVDIWKQDWPVPATADLVPYIAYHHAHHGWSRLHWAMDLTMVTRHPSFDRTEALRRADAFGVRGVTEAALELPACLSAMAQGDACRDVPKLAAAFAGECVAGLEETGSAAAAERRRSDGVPIGAVVADVRRSLALHDRPAAKLRGLLVPLSPKIADYLARPLPPKRHWIYWVTRPIRLAFRRRRS